jgi:hypothetical protein
MFDRDRLFRVLFHLSGETNDFLVAQDAYETIRSCIHQIKNCEVVLGEMEGKLKSIEGISGGEELVAQREHVLSCVDRLLEVQSHRELWISFLNPLLEEAREFWFCCPVDHTHCIGENQSPMEKWRHFKESKILESVLLMINEFKHHCLNLVNAHFPDLLSILQEEVDREQAPQTALTQDQTRFLNETPVALIPDFHLFCHSMMVSTKFPRTHFHSVDTHFVQLLGYCTARLLGIPITKYIFNVTEKALMNKQFDNAAVANPTVMKLLYRTATGRIVGVLWMLGAYPIDDTFCAVGMDITPEIESSRLKQSASIQKMLKQWLHSIRNASFEQQARVILEEVQNLKTKVNRSELREDFDSISECVKLLMHTARTSVGLIDQALETRGLTQHMCVSDFVSNITSFPHHFAQSEGIPAIYTRYRFLLNGNPASPQDYSSFFVTGDIISLQSIVDNIISNAVR